MKREEYMGALASALEGFDEELVQEIVSDYEERFRIGQENGKTEEMVIQELGSIKDLVDELGEMQQGAEAKKEQDESSYRQEQAENNSNTNDYNGKSGTYYQEKSFADSFDSAIKKFGKVLDGVMKEAGRVIEEAAEQIEYHMEEAKKNHYYTYNGDGTCEGSEKDMEGEPNVEQSGQGIAGCRRVVVEADIADVKVRSTKESEPKAVCHYYSHKTAMLYPFYARQEGDTFYVGVKRNQDQERKSGFFQFSMSPSIEINLLLPEDVVLVEVSSISGDLELNEVKTEELYLRSKSGDITSSYVTCNRCGMESLSGDLSLTKSTVKVAELTTKSGDCEADRLEAGTLSVSTASGDAEIKSVQAVSATVNTMSGDITADAMQCQNNKFHTASGDLSISDCHGELLEANSVSGDISIRADYKKYTAKTQSGDLTLESRHDADITAQSTSGDVGVHIVEALETYQVTMHSVSGDCTTSGQTKSADTVPTKNIEAKTISGDIRVRFF